MPLVTSTEMFRKAYEGGYAIGAFNVNNMEIVQGIMENSIFPWTNRPDKKHIKDLVIGRSTDCTFEVINEQKVSGVYTAGLCWKVIE